MKKLLLSLPVIALSTAFAWAGHDCKGGCPSQIEGASVAVENSAEGVIVRITAKDPAAIKKIQDAAAEHFKKGAACPDCKDGKKCAKCKEGKKAHACKACKEGKKCAKCAGKDGKADAKAKFVCPMGCASSDKPGKCPKCNMDLKEAGK